MFAVVTIQGKQYTVSKGQVIHVDKLVGKAGETVTFDHVLLKSTDGKTSVGSPTVHGATVTAKILSQDKGEKIDIRRYKSKVRERRHVGFRAKLTKLEIVSIG